MSIVKSSGIIHERIVFESVFLGRGVMVDFFSLENLGCLDDISLLIINDGQELEKLGLRTILQNMYSQSLLRPLICVGIHANGDRVMEYGITDTLDYMGRGAKAKEYAYFVLNELLPLIYLHFNIKVFKEKAFAGFSLGALSAMDIVWNHPSDFCRLGLFSGSFWWRTRDKGDPDYNENKDRIMQRQVREGSYQPGLRFFFECGTEDEAEDRNHNGVIDSIDDTQDLIKELVAKGYDPATDIRYWEIEGGRHEVDTWAKAMPEFLRWGWG